MRRLACFGTGFLGAYFGPKCAPKVRTQNLVTKIRTKRHQSTYPKCRYQKYAPKYALKYAPKPSTKKWISRREISFAFFEAFLYSDDGIRYVCGGFLGANDRGMVCNILENVVVQGGGARELSVWVRGTSILLFDRVLRKAKYMYVCVLPSGGKENRGRLALRPPPQKHTCPTYIRKSWP